MSSFIVSDQTIHNVVRAINHCGCFPTHGLPADIMTSNDKIGQALYNLNSRAVAGRYNQPVKLQVYRYRGTNMPPSKKGRIALYKSLQCLVYQCAGDTTVDDNLFKALDEMKAHMATHIISDLAEYQSAPWDA